MKTSFGGFCLVFFAGLVAPVLGQISDSPVTIRLEPRQLGDGSYKYGIYAAMAGSTTPQLYELDTGGAGFWPVYGTGEYATPAWGPNFTPIGVPVNVTYDSGNIYEADAVIAAVSLYSANGSGQAESTPALTTGDTMLLGMTTSITNSKGHSTSGEWPSTHAPVDGHFYGDFGLSLIAAVENGIQNILAQMDYGSLVPGYVIQLGYAGNPNASLQIGLPANYAEEFPIQFTIPGKDTVNLFNGSELPTYGEGVLEANMTLDNSESGEHTYPLTLVLDTGASPNLHITEGVTPESLYDYLHTDPDDKMHVVDDTHLILSSTDQSSALIELLNVLTGNSADKLKVGAQDGGMFYDGYYFNVGQELFYHYDIAYDIENGILALRPIPEPRACGLMALMTLLGACLCRGLRRRVYCTSTSVE